MQMGKKKWNHTPWDFLQNYKGEFFTEEWPTLSQMFRITAHRFPDRRCFEAFSPEHILFTYNEAKDKIDAIAAYLQETGVKPGDKIALTGKNSPEWALSYLAIATVGAVIVPLDYSLHDVDIEKFIKFSGATRLFVDEERIDLIDKDGSLGLVERISLEKTPGSPHPYVLDLAGSSAPVYPETKIADLAAIMFTSGTTGTPKGVMLTNHNLVSDCYLAQAHMNLSHTDTFYAILPIHHSYTMLAVFLESMSVGAAVVFGKKLVISHVFKELRDGKVTMFLGVPMLFNKLLSGLLSGIKEKGIVLYGIIRGLMGVSGFIKKVFKVNPGKKMFGFLLKKIALENNRVCICGGGPLPSSTFKMFNELGIDFVQGYGLTETSPIINLNPQYAYIEDSVGKMIPGIEMKIKNPDANGIGEIMVKGPVVMQGYYNNPEATAEVLSPDGWLNTGDVGYLDAGKYLYLTGRSKSLIVTEGGKNVFPEEIEDKFQLFTEIEQICIIGYIINPKTKGEGIRAIVLPSDVFRKKVASALSDEAEAAKAIESRIQEIITQVNRDLPPYKKISRLTVTDEPMPMSSTKKIKRYLVAEKFKDK